MATRFPGSPAIVRFGWDDTMFHDVVVCEIVPREALPSCPFADRPSLDSSGRTDAGGLSRCVILTRIVLLTCMSGTGVCSRTAQQDRRKVRDIDEHPKLGCWPLGQSNSWVHPQSSSRGEMCLSILGKEGQQATRRVRPMPEDDKPAVNRVRHFVLYTAIEPENSSVVCPEAR